MDVKYSEINTSVEVGKIDGHQKRIGAKVVKFPFYDPEKSRVKSLKMIKNTKALLEFWEQANEKIS